MSAIMSGCPRPVVFIARGVPPSGAARLREVCDVIEWEGPGRIPQDTFVERVGQCKPNAVLIHPPDRVDRQLLDSAGPQLKVVGTMSVGLDHVDLEECRRRGVAVGYTPNVLTSAVAEHAVGLILGAARKYKPGMRAIHSSVWGTRWDNALWMAGKEIGGSVVGIVGLGRIGIAVAKRLKSFDPARIIYCGSGPKDDAKQVGAEFVPFEELLKHADFVIATCSINEGNKGLFNKGVFDKMKTSSIFVNVSRGVLVNQEDLHKALTTGVIGGAALDVTSPEPLPADHPLLSLDNCLVIPHLGSATDTTRNRMCNLTVSNILAGLKGETLPSSAL
ncbi:glyoxylate reductase/hydroxypyruvate reductase-like [Haliotis cracherodii]|uniref:glyoxylate reductase/hydroxypyruvate reductase-like n=1 Tax=Haliotis cracherodii TaxID=6455 RepID=UPI0039EC946D